MRRRPRRSWVVAVAVATGVVVSGHALGSAPLPTPGGARGATTGDGAFTGLASAPTANLFTGTASTRIEIQVPPGRGGATPRLALTYSSAGPRSPVGYGWSLAIGQVRRRTDAGPPRYDDGDEFLLELPGGSFELERDPSRPGGYRERYPRAMYRVAFDAAANSWTAIDTGGTSYRFGTARAARTGPGESVDETFAWKLSRIEDAAGNGIDFEYADAADAPSRSGLPERVLYGDNERARYEHHAEVRFVWGARPYPSTPVVSYRAGYPARIERLLVAVETYAGGDIARRYDLSHSSARPSGSYRLDAVTVTGFADDSANDVTLPSTVFLYADDVETGWPLGDPADVDAAATHVDGPAAIRDNDDPTGFDLLDVNGDGWVDHLTARSSPPSVRLGGPGGFAEPQEWSWPAGSATRDVPRALRVLGQNNALLVNVFDIDGDGLPDLVDGRSGTCDRQRPQYWCVYLNDGQGFSATPLHWWAPSDGLRHGAPGGTTARVDLIDLDGDGRPDWVRADTIEENRLAWTVHLNTGDGFETTATDFPAWADRTVLVPGGRQIWGVVDMNGDGLPDLMNTRVAPEYINDDYRPLQDHWDVFLNTGNGFSRDVHEWRVEGAERPMLPWYLAAHIDSGNATTVDLVDVTGDGLPDLLMRNLARGDPVGGIEARCEELGFCDQVRPTTVPIDLVYCCYQMLLFVNTGSSFAAPVPWRSPTQALRARYRDCDLTSLCNGTVLHHYDTLDFDGDGLVDLVDVGDPVYRPGQWRVFAHPSARATTGAPGRAPPGRLIAMLNGIGGSTTLEYRPTSYTADPRMPGAHWVVARRAQFDGRDETPAAVQTFDYRGARYDADTRRFHGFAEVRECDGAGRCSTHRFHQDRRRLGLAYEVVRSVCSSGAPCVDADTETLGIESRVWPDEGPVLLAELTLTPFAGGAPHADLSRRERFEYDEFANATTVELSGPSFETVTTRTAFSRRIVDAGGQPSTYIVNKPTHTTTGAAGDASPLVEKRYGYDWSRSPAGLAASIETCRFWDAKARCSDWVARTVAYDRAGNAVRTRGDDGATSETEYGPFGLFAVEATAPDRARTRAAYCPKTGNVLRTVDPRGDESGTTYDGFGRPLDTWGPVGDAARPLTETRYVLGNGTEPSAIVTRTRGRAPSAVYFDGLGREVARKSLRTTAAGTVALVEGFKRYDEGGRVVAEALPFTDSTLGLERLGIDERDAPSWATYAYDGLGRLAERRMPDGTTLRYDRSRPGVLVTHGPTFSGDDGRAWTIERFDGLGRRTREVLCTVLPKAAACPADATLTETAFTYDGLDRAVERSVVDPANRNRAVSVAIDYDGLGHRQGITRSGVGTWRYERDEYGRPREVIPPAGRPSRLRYDDVGRIVQHRAGPLRAKYRYVRRGRGRGKVAKVQVRAPDLRLTKTFLYDAEHRRVGETHAVALGGIRETRSAAFGYLYDELDRRTAVVYPGPDWAEAYTVETAYDESSSVVSIRHGAQPIVSAVDRDAFGNVARIDYGNGLSDRVERHRPTAAGPLAGTLRCTRTTYANLDGGACTGSAFDLRLVEVTSSDAAGNTTEVVDRTPNRPGALVETRALDYDPAGRLVRAQFADGDAEAFAYDGLGNLVAVNDRLLLYHPWRPHQLLAVREPGATDRIVEHDARGRRTRDGRRAYAFDDLDRLIEIREDGDAVTRLHYDESGRRIARVDVRSGDSELSFAGLATLTAEGWTYAIDLGGSPVAEVRVPHAPGATRVHYFHRDERGSIRAVSDEFGQIAEHLRYSAYGRARRLGPFGAPSPRAETPWTFSGYLDDRPSRLLLADGRPYDPDTASFLTLDPASQFASPYLYAGGSPYAGIDPDGRFLFGLTALELIATLTATATFVDSLVAGGDPLGALTAGAIAGASTFASAATSAAATAVLPQSLPLAMKYAVALASQGYRIHNAVDGIRAGTVSGALAAGVAAASLVGVESGHARPRGSDEYALQGIHVGEADADGLVVIEVDGICGTAPGCVTNFVNAVRENLRNLFTGGVGCVSGCELVAGAAVEALSAGNEVELRCNSFGGIKCAGAVQRLYADQGDVELSGLRGRFTGTPLLRPPKLSRVTYPANLFDPVVWVGTGLRLPTRSDVVLGKNWWVPAPLLVHHPRLYHEPLGQIVSNPWSE